MRVGIVYIIKNRVNEKVYIGQTLSSLSERWNAHIRRSRDISKKYKIYNAMRKHGVENFYIEILENKVNQNIIDDLERSYIEKFDSFINGYNSTRGGDGKIFSNIEENEIVRRYQNGENSTELGEIYDVSWRTIIRILEKHNIRRRDRKSIPDINSFKEDYNSGMSLSDMADKYEVEIKTITRERNRLNLTKRMTRSRPSIQKDFGVDEFINDYQSGMSLIDMAKKYQVDVKTIGKRRNKLKLPKRKLK